MRRLILTATVLGTSMLIFGAVPAAAGGGCHVEKHTSARTASVDMKQACMIPTNVYVDPGTTVTWTNRDDFDHVVIGVGWQAGQMVEQGDSVSHRFDAAGIFPYTCSLHGGMNGAVVVGDVSTLADVDPAASVHEVTTDSVAAGSMKTKPKQPEPNPLTDIPVPAAATGLGLVSAAAGYGIGSVRRRRQLP